jgi:hypothetical protein
MRGTHRIIRGTGFAVLSMMTAGAGGHKKGCIASLCDDSGIERRSEIVYKAIGCGRMLMVRAMRRGRYNE